MWKKCQRGEWSCFVFVKSSCEGVDFNQIVVTPMQTLHEHPNDVYFGKVEIFVDVHVNTTFVHINLSINIWALYHFKEFFAYMWLEIWRSIHTPNVRSLAYYDLHILA